MGSVAREPPLRNGARSRELDIAGYEAYQICRQRKSRRQVVEINDYLGDHYDPTSKRFACRRTFTTAICRRARFAAHEPATQSSTESLAPQGAHIVPITQVASQMLPFIIIGGFIFHLTGLITLRIYCYLILAFQLITLPWNSTLPAGPKLFYNKWVSCSRAKSWV